LVTGELLQTEDATAAAALSAHSPAAASEKKQFA